METNTGCRRYDATADQADDIRRRLIDACAAAKEAGKRIGYGDDDGRGIVSPFGALVLAEHLDVPDGDHMAVARAALGVDVSFIFWLLEGMRNVSDIAPPAEDLQAFNLGAEIAAKFVMRSGRKL